MAFKNPHRPLIACSLLALALQQGCANDQEKEDATTAGEKEDEASKEPGSQKESNSKKDTGSDPEDNSPSGSPEEVVPEEYRGQENPFELDDTKALEAGKKVYEEDCEGCHGRSGEGGFPGTPDFRSAKAKAWPSDWILWKVSEGSGEMMPAYKGILSTEQIWQSITFIRSLEE